jgi:uncharacterized protein (TIGR02453 family)
MPFEGFSIDTLAFLGDLAEHNDRTWFAENRPRFEAELLGRQRDFVDAVGAAFAAAGQAVQAIPEVDRSIFRLNRDLRFARDKSPYKTYSDLFFWIGDNRKSSPGYFLRFEPGSISIGCGAHTLTDEQIARYRFAVDDGISGQWLAHIMEDLVAKGFEPNEPQRKTVPKGYSAQHPRAELLKNTYVHALKKCSPPPAEFYGPEFVDWSMEQFEQVKPLVSWLNQHLSGVFPPTMRL